MKLLKWLTVLILLLVIGFAPTSCRKHDLRIGSKKFTESIILGEMVRLDAQSNGIEAIHYRDLGGTQIVYKGLVAGQLDVYPEYTGTLAFEILRLDEFDQDVVNQRLAEQGIRMSKPLGFNNSYALGMKRERAESLGITRISDLANHPQLVMRFGNEFIERKDGWAPLRDAYGLAQQDVRGIDHDVAYRELDAGNADVIDVYTTDSKIKLYDVLVLRDDRDFFPRYDAVLLYRESLEKRGGAYRDLVHRLEGQITGVQMIRLDAAATLEQQPEANVAAQFLKEQLSIEVEVQDETFFTRLVRNTLGHLDLVRTSLIAAILVAIPLGIVAARFKPLGTVILATVGIVQTLPGLAILVLLIAPVKALGMSSIGSGSVPVLVALFLYSLLPIVRNTYTGLTSVPVALQESADALGLSSFAKLVRIELPMASPTILAGIKTSAVINVGFATLGALIGAPGYGQPILAGIRLENTRLILEGAIPAAVLAVVVQLVFEAIEHFAVPKGLRL